jgi:hypothetical protein
VGVPHIYSDSNYSPVSGLERKSPDRFHKKSNKITKRQYAAHAAHVARLALLDIARKELGKKEEPKGSNWGPDVQVYLKSVGLEYSQPWCMAFCYWVVAEYCNQEGIKNPLYKTGHVGKQNQMCPSLRVNKPQPGDIFIMIFKDGSGHCGFVERVDGNRIYTIEGNSNTDGSPNGYEVCRKANGRRTKEVKNFLRVIK